MRASDPDDGLWFVLTGFEHEIYREAPTPAPKFEYRRRRRQAVTGPLDLLANWHDTETVLPT